MAARLAMTTLDAHAVLRGQPLFSALDGGELDELLDLARPFTAPAGTLLFRQGDESDGLYVIADGEVAVRARVPGDTETELARLGRGGILGELALLDHGRRSASAEAVHATTGLYFSTLQFAGLRSARRRSARRVLDHLAGVVCARIRERIEDLARAAERGCEPRIVDGDRGARIARTAEFSSAGPEVAAIPPAALRTLPLFRGLTPGEVEQVLAAGRLVELPRGQVLWQEGETPDRCYVTLRGAVMLSVERAGRVETCAVLGPGRFVGAVGVIDRKPQPADGTVREHAWLLELTGDAVLAHRGTELVVDELVDELRVLTRRFARLTAQGRLAGC
jgi:CRP/FNR family transcriptional regulator, cyclic AMP receptor protein